MGNFIGVIKTRKFWHELTVMTLAMLVAAAAIYYFLLPSNLIIGSVAGLAMEISAVFAAFGVSIKVSLIITTLNAILLILAFAILGRDFGAKTVYTALIVGPCMDLWNIILPYQNLIEAGKTSVMGDLWFDMLCFVLLVSISQAILFNINASSGGLDITAKILNKYFHTDIGSSVAICGFVICFLAFFINPFRLVVIGIIGTWINGVAVDYFTAGINRRKRVCIISGEPEKIRAFIISKLVRGCSMYEVTGGYTQEKSVEVQALLTQTEFAELMDFIKREDINAFITAGNVSEVYGLWNKHK